MLFDRLIQMRAVVASAVVALLAVFPLAEAAAAEAVYSLQLSEMEVDEGGRIKFKVKRNRDTGEERVRWRTRNDTATGYEDYEYIHTRELRFAPGQTTKTIVLASYEDGLAEGDEVFNVQLRSANSGGRIGSPSTLAVTLVDGEGSPPPADPPPSPPPPSPPPPSPPPPGDDGFTAPQLLSAVQDGRSYTLTWSHPRQNLDGGFDMIVDGVDTNRAYRTGALTQTINNLQPTVSHCFQIEARYKQAGRFPRSDTLCVDPNSGGNRAPSISGQPNPIAETGRPWSFTPNASDPDNDHLSFSISNKPGWASFNAANGRLAGTPGANNVRTYNNIVIRVSDGTAQAALPSFSIEVRETAQSSGTAALSWTPPTRRVDGSPLTDLQGYRIYKGANPSSLQVITEFGNPGVTNFLVEGLAAGRWFFSITATDSVGQESGFSNTVFKDVN